VVAAISSKADVCKNQTKGKNLHGIRHLSLHLQKQAELTVKFLDMQLRQSPGRTMKHPHKTFAHLKSPARSHRLS
jgi:hypothetical protein